MENNTKILVVDDDSAIGDMLKILLEMNGYEVTVSEIPNKNRRNHSEKKHRLGYFGHAHLWGKRHRCVQ